MKRLPVGFGLIAIGLMGWGLQMGTANAAAQDEAANPEFYTTKVQPIFQANCYRCHGGMNHRGGLNIQTRAGMLQGGHDGPVLIPGDASNSLLVRLIRHEGPPKDPMPMPPKQPKLSDTDIATVERWVKAGAIMPDEVQK
ncbi:c-type cytochrome domain-containing protein [Tunturibacter psychrotolerans]|uniref:C-type cytochrome domain-containing protein n=1 Tax=Tunturiibacter psychrotolerans TaxID=3069686 RepID=A0AAU7ZRC4_9BACT